MLTCCQSHKVTIGRINNTGSPQNVSTAQGHHRTCQQHRVTTGRVNNTGSPQDVSTTQVNTGRVKSTRSPQDVSTAQGHNRTNKRCFKPHIENSCTLKRNSSRQTTSKILSHASGHKHIQQPNAAKQSIRSTFQRLHFKLFSMTEAFFGRVL